MNDEEKMELSIKILFDIKKILNSHRIEKNNVEVISAAFGCIMSEIILGIFPYDEGCNLLNYFHKSNMETHKLFSQMMKDSNSKLN